MTDAAHSYNDALGGSDLQRTIAKMHGCMDDRQKEDGLVHVSRRPTAIGISICLATLLTGIGSCSDPTPARHVRIAREVLLEQGRGGLPAVITATKDGGFVVAGDAGAAWATRVSAQGAVLWRYLDTGDENRGGPSQSSFSGAVMLADDSVVLCGSKYLSDRQVGLLVHINAQGEVLNTEYVSAKGEQPRRLNSFHRCLRWGDGVAVLGFVPGGAPRADGWLMKLNAAGRREWEMVGQDYASKDAIEMADHSLVLAINDTQEHAGHYETSTQLVRVDREGRVQGKRDVACGGYCSHFTLFRPVAPTARIGFESLDWPNATMHSLDLTLKDLHPPVHSRAMATNRGYELPDGTVLLFGSVGANGASAASIGQLDAAGRFSVIHVFQPTWSENRRQINEESIAVDDAVATSATEFGLVRAWSAAKREHVGIYVDWVSIQ